MLISAIKTERRRKPAPANTIDREAVSRYLLSLAAAKLDYAILGDKEEALVEAAMRLPFDDVLEKRMFCQDLGLLIRDLRFPPVWNAQHLDLLLKLNRKEQPATDLARLGVICSLGENKGVGCYSLLSGLVDKFSTIPDTSVQWLELLRLLYREMAMEEVAHIVNSGCLQHMNAADLQRLGRLRKDQLQAWCLLVPNFKGVDSVVSDLLFYFVSRLGFSAYRMESTVQLLCEFVREVLPRAEVRINRYNCSFLPGGNGPLAGKAYDRAFGIFAFWLLHRGAHVDFLTDRFDATLPGTTPEEVLGDFRRLSFRQVIDYLPVRWLWSLLFLWKRHLRLLVHLGAGKNIRTFYRLRLPVSKRMAHLFHNLPPGDHRSVQAVNASFREVYWKSIGGEGRLLPMLPPFRWLKEGFPVFHPQYRKLRQQFPQWEKVLKRLIFLINKDPVLLELPSHEIRMLFGYFRYLINEGLPLNLQGSTLRSLQRRVETWRQESRMRQIAGQSESGVVSESWAEAPYRDLELEVEGALYRIVQVTTLKALFEEADAMRHCVWRYHPKCVKGACSIWSLRRCEPEKETRLATIEVNGNGRIVQAKGKFNAKPELLYLDLIERWAEQAGMAFQRGVLR